MHYKLPPLPYSYDALGKYISKNIMELHHDKHHQTYVDKLNAALDGVTGDIRQMELVDLLRSVDKLPEDVQGVIRNNGGGHYNHSLFWRWMSPDGSGQPKGETARLINERYGNFQNFVDEFTTKSLGVFGSGWVWLQPDMSIITTPNQDNPLNKGLDEPVLGLDVWEHAYYLDYKNKRDDYIKAWWQVVNWEFVESRFLELRK